MLHIASVYSLVFILMRDIDFERQPVITALGGGSGLSLVVRAALEGVPGAQVNSGVTMFDTGGSTGRLSEALGISPVGDVSRNVLAGSSVGAAELLTHQRFGRDATVDCVRQASEDMLVAFGHDPLGDMGKIALLTAETAELVVANDPRGLAGHSLRNLVLASYNINGNNPTDAAAAAAELWRSKSRTLPVTHDPAALVMVDGQTTVYGESDIDEYPTEDISRVQVRLDRRVRITDEAEAAIENADLLIVAPGSLTTSVLAALTPRDVQEAVSRSRATMVVIPSPVRHTGMGDEPIAAADWVRLVSRHSTRTPDHVVLDTSIPAALRPIARQDDVAHFGDTAYVRELLDISTDTAPDQADELAHLRTSTHYSATKLGAVLRQMVTLRSPVGARG